MASSGKKGKKPKGTAISLQTFLSNGDMPPSGTTQVAKNVRNIDGDDSDDGDNILTLVCQLPTAPRANRVFDENPVPYKAPFIAYVTNLPFDINEDDIYDFFNNNHIVSVRLPREDGETGRVRGFGYIEFETRDDLIHALGLPDPSIKGRRIRIELSNETDQNSRQRGNRRNYDTSINSENRESTNWRRDNQKNSAEFERIDHKSSYSDATASSWRSRNRSYGADVGSDGKQFGCTHAENSDAMLERPKLNLKPRTLPLPEQDIASSRNEIVSSDKSYTLICNKFTGVSAEKVFGSAKPVDTTARDLEIEQRLSEIRRQECLQNEIDTSTNIINDIHIQSMAKEPLMESNWRKNHSNEDVNKKHLESESRRDTAMVNRRKCEEHCERYDNSEDMPGDGKQKDVNKGKRDCKVGRPLAKYSLNQNEAVLVSSNKYSGLDEALE